jgi:uncharacterized membrane protein YccC
MTKNQMLGFVALCAVTMLMPSLIFFWLGPGPVQMVVFCALYALLLAATVLGYRRDPQVAVTGIIVLALIVLMIAGSPSLREVMRFRPPNHPAAGKAGIATLLAIERPCPGPPEPVRSAT